MGVPRFSATRLTRPFSASCRSFPLQRRRPRPLLWGSPPPVLHPSGLTTWCLGFLSLTCPSFSSHLCVMISALVPSAHIFSPGAILIVPFPSHHLLERLCRACLCSSPPLPHSTAHFRLFLSPSTSETSLTKVINKLLVSKPRGPFGGLSSFHLSLGHYQTSLPTELPSLRILLATYSTVSFQKARKISVFF